MIILTLLTLQLFINDISLHNTLYMGKKDTFHIYLLHIEIIILLYHIISIQYKFPQFSQYYVHNIHLFILQYIVYEFLNIYPMLKNDRDSLDIHLHKVILIP